LPRELRSELPWGAGAYILDRSPEMQANPPPSEALSQAQTELFAAHADTWWDAAGAFSQLHRITPLRMAFLVENACAHFGRDPKIRRPLDGLRALDIGCGGGLVCEPLARLGAAVTGIDAVAENLEVARAHAEEAGLDVTYLQAAPEDLASRGQRFDLVINMEVIEHAADPASFMAGACSLVDAKGAMAASTISRTLKSLTLAKVGAEYVLRWVPPGTHDWRKFVKPSELARHLRAGGLTLKALQGLVYDPMRREWRLSRDVDVNYLAFAVR
jgi:2-polyprenyl-6-hydroxyphenyl methylase / 3-demethylubiquinone-9 3-methyltransferase